MRTAALLLAAGLVAASLGFAPNAVAEPVAQQAGLVMPSAVKYKFKNCTALNKVYPHGVGRNNAKDHTSGTRVTNFKHSTSLYKKVIGYRKGLDRDHDGIACEKA
jgi:hypothetical protein